MSGNENNQLNTTEAVDAISFKQFLETTPPAHSLMVRDAIRMDKGDAYLRSPILELHCPECGGERMFRVNRSRDQEVYFKESYAELFHEYVCSNCRRQPKKYSLVIRNNEVAGSVSIYKFGEFPPFGPPTPTRLLDLLGEHRDLFLKGRRCEFQGLGVGAFSYYRRVVEYQKSSLIGEIVKAAKRLNVADSVINALQAAKEETQFSKSVELVKDAIPQALLIQGHNPLVLLHSALSEGLHDRSDEHCLEFAQEIRVVLVDLAERISQVMKDHAELKASISRLLNRKIGIDQNEGKRNKGLEP